MTEDFSNQTLFTGTDSEQPSSSVRNLSPLEYREADHEEFEYEEQEFDWSDHNDSNRHEFVLEIRDASITTKPKLSAYVRNELLKASQLWGSDRGHASTNAMNRAKACRIVEQFLTCEFDTTTHDEFFFTDKISADCSEPSITTLDFSGGVMPKIVQARAGVALNVLFRLRSCIELDEWQEDHGSVSGGIVLRFWHRAFLDRERVFHRGPSSILWQVTNGEVTLDPFYDAEDS